MTNDAVHQCRTAKEQQAAVWETLLSHHRQNMNNNDNKNREWPTYDAVMSHMASADYTETLTCPLDLLPSQQNQQQQTNYSNNNRKVLCPHGVVCCARVDLFDFPADTTDAPYTGLLTPNTTLPHCLVRLSTAMKPPNLEIKAAWARALLYATGEKLRNASLFPAAALKVFCDDNDNNTNTNTNNNSANLLLGGSKVGQREDDFFAHCLCTTMTEQMPRAVRPFVRKFWSYSDYPLSLGVSDFCRVQRGGSSSCSSAGDKDNDEDCNFPFCVIWKPVYKPDAPVNGPADSSATEDNATAPPTPQSPNVDASSFDSFVDTALHNIPPGTKLYDIYACPDPYAVPDPSRLQRIGRLTTTSRMIPSTPNDGLFFRHQVKEDDYALRPTWPRALKATVQVGSTKGTVGKMAGWKLFEQHIAKGQYVDFEKAAAAEQERL